MGSDWVSQLAKQTAGGFAAVCIQWGVNPVWLVDTQYRQGRKNHPAATIPHISSLHAHQMLAFF
jgi:hypothetical protein